MKASTFRFVIVAFCTIFTQWACQPTGDTLIEPTAQKISIAEARRHYEAWAKPNARSSTELQNREPLWSLAKETAFKDGVSAVVTPILYNYGMRLGLFLGDQLTENQKKAVIQTNLLTYRDKAGVIQSYIMSVLPDEAYRSLNERVNGETFSGLVIVKELGEDKAVETWLYKDGKGRRISLDDKNGRRMGCEEFIYELADGTSLPAQQGTGGDATSYEIGDPYITIGGHIWKKVGSVSVPCGGGSSSSTGGSGGDGGYSGYGGSGGDSGGGGGPSGGGGEYTPIMLTDQGVTGLNPVDNFFYKMENERNPPVFFTQEEKKLVGVYPQLMYKIGPFIDATGQKPDMNELV